MRYREVDFMDVKISIIMPVYNAENYIRQSINSILSQSFKDFELILVNDGSTDNSEKICNEYRMKYNFIKLVSKKNGGAASARNAGLDIAKGKYIAFADSDDILHRDMYSILYKIAEENNTDIVICNFLNINSKENVDLIEYKDIDNIQIFNNIEALNSIYQGFNVRMIVPWNKIYKKDLFKMNRFKEGRICEDEFLAHKILYEAKKIAYVDLVLYYYVQTENSVMRKPLSKKNLDSVYAFKNRVDFFKEKKLEELLYRAQVIYYNEFFQLYYKFNAINLDCKREYNMLRRDFIKMILIYIKNPFCEFKEKFSIMLFMINPTIYKVYEKSLYIKNKLKNKYE